MDRRQFIALSAATAGAAFAGAAVATPSAADEAEAFARRRRFVDLPAGRIAYVERGRGPAAVFLHGFPLNGFQWRGALERLSPYRRCIAPDVLGMGYTVPAAGQSLAPQAQADMLATLLDALDAGSVDIVANDSGCAIAQLFLRSHPDRVRTLLLTNGDTEIDCPPAALAPVIELARKGRFVAEWLAPWLADKTLARSPTGLGGLTYTYPQALADATLDTYLEPLVRNADATNAYAVALAPNVLAGMEPVLRATDLPVRIVWGMADDTFSQAAPDYLDALLPGSRGVRRVEGARLFFAEEFPDLIAAEARALWGV